MKDIYHKVKINPLTYILILSLCLTGYFQLLIVLGLIIVSHEIGHLIVIKYFKYEISEISFFPFGGIIKCKKAINSPLKEELILAISGILMQVIVGFIIFFLFDAGFIRSFFYHLFYRYNVILIIFNLLPIIPLDGHIIVKSLLEYILPYRLAFFISVLIGGLGLFVFIWLNIYFAINNFLILGFLIYKIFESIKTFPYYQLRFFLERILHYYPFKRIKIIKGNQTHKMFKERRHFFLQNKTLTDEYVILKKKFDGKHYF